MKSPFVKRWEQKRSKVSESDRQARAIEKILNAHLGLEKEAGAPPYSIHNDALWCVLGGDGLGAVSPGNERKKLEELLRASRQFTRTWNSMNYHVQRTIIAVSRDLAQQEFEKIPIGNPRGEDVVKFWLDVARHLDVLVEATISDAHSAIEIMPDAANRKIRELATVETLERLWIERRGKPLPRSIQSTHPFAQLVAEVFEVLGMSGNPRALLDGLRKYRKAYPSD